MADTTDTTEPTAAAAAEVVLTPAQLFFMKDRSEQTGTITLDDGSIAVYKLGKLNGVLTKPNGDKFSFKEDMLFSEKGEPTIEYANGDKHYYEDNILVMVHYTDGRILVGDEIP